MLLDSVLHYLKPRPRPAHPAKRGAPARRRATYRLCLEALEDRSLPSVYVQTNLAADQPGAALVHDPELIDAWGISINPAGTFWLSARATDVSTVYSGDVTQPDGSRSPFVKSTLTVTIPGGAPTGQVFNGSGDFVVSSGAFSGPARFIFASETGHITGWNPGVPPPPPSRIAHIKASTPGAVYTGLAIGNNGVGNFLYAADFRGDKIDVFNGTYTPTTLPGSFEDPGIPDDYAPFNIWNLGGTLFVTYARPKDHGDGLLRGGKGFVSAFDTNGNFLRRVISEDHLKSPWGIALAPADFGEFGGALIVGNHQTGHINAFNPTTGEFLGRLRNANGGVLHIDGLFALHFGNGTVSGDRNALYFAAAPHNGAHGLFGSLRVMTTAPLAPTGSRSDNSGQTRADAALLLDLVINEMPGIAPLAGITPDPTPDRNHSETSGDLDAVSSSGHADSSNWLGVWTRATDDSDSLAALDDFFSRDSRLGGEGWDQGWDFLLA